MTITTTPTDPPAFFLGIDVGKADLFCYMLGPAEPCSERFDNTSAGIKLLVKWLSKAAPSSQLHACLEQTGHYGDAMAQSLHVMPGTAVHLVNPHRIKAFGMQKLRRNKSDTADAKLSARFLKSEHLELRPSQPKSPVQQEVTSLSRYADSITQDTARLKTMLEGQPDKIVSASIKRRIKSQEKELKSVRAKIAQLIKWEPLLDAKSKLLRSIPGLGDIATQIVLAELPDLEQFADARQLAAWAGLTPQHHTSGTSGRVRTPI